MFCPNCGAQIQDGAAFCAACGTNLSAGTGAPVQQYPAPRRVKKSLIIGICVAVVAVVVAIILCVTLIGSGGAKGTLEKYLDGMTSFDGEAIYKYASERVHGYDSLEDCVEEAEEQKKTFEAFGVEMKISYEIVDEKEVSVDDISSSIISYVEEEKGGEVTEAAVFDVVVTASYSSITNDDEMTLTLLKVNGEWIVADE